MDNKFRFKLDKDKIKLQLKELGKKFARKKSNFRNGLLIFMFFVLIGVGFAIYNNDDQQNNMSETSLDRQSFENQPLQIEYGEDQPSFYSEETSGKDFSLNHPDLQQQEITDKDEQKQKDLTASKQFEGVVTEPVKPVSQIQGGEQAITLLKPVSGEVLQQSGWYYNNVFDDWRYQNGIEFAGKTGDIVMAADSGRVSSVKEDQYMGIVVVIEHQDGWSTEYGHLQRSTVSPGEQVSKGQEIGLIGTTGMISQPSLYFTLKNKDGAIDPVKYFD